MREGIEHSVREAIEAISFLEREESIRFIEEVAKSIAEAFERGNKVLIAGNGGSLCDAMHFAEELTGVFRKKRKALPVIALSDCGHLTCVGNDLGYDEVFARGVEALGQKDDLLILLTTSGNSPNLIRAMQVAQEKEILTVAFLGKNGGGKLHQQCDHEWIVRGFQYSDRIQEVHMAALHIIIEQVEELMFYRAEAHVT